MPMRANPWYNSSVLAQVGSNLAAAIYGDPDAKYKASADQRANEAMRIQTERWAAEQGDAERKDAALQTLASVMQDPKGDPRAAAGQAVLAGLSPQQVMAVFGTADPSHQQALDRLRQEWGYRNTDREDQQAHDASMLDARGQQQMGLLAQEFNQILARLAAEHSYDDQSAARDHGYQMDRDAALYGFDLGKLGVQNLFDMEQLDREISAGRYGVRPTKITPKDAINSEFMLTQALDAMARGEDGAAVGFEIDPQLMQQLKDNLASAYRDTGNFQSALSSVLEGVTVTPGVDNWGPWNTPGQVTARQPGPPASPAQPQGAAPTVNTQAEYDALPSGATFIDAQDGKMYRKP